MRRASMPILAKSQFAEASGTGDGSSPSPMNACWISAFSSSIRRGFFGSVKNAMLPGTPHEVGVAVHALGVGDGLRAVEQERRRADHRALVVGGARRLVRDQVAQRGLAFDQAAHEALDGRRDCSRDSRTRTA